MAKCRLFSQAGGGGGGAGGGGGGGTSRGVAKCRLFSQAGGVGGARGVGDQKKIKQTCGKGDAIVLFLLWHLK